MFKFSNIVIFAGVLLFHYAILQRLLIAPPDQVVKQDLAVAGTILEISLIPEMRMESASANLPLSTTSAVEQEEESEKELETVELEKTVQSLIAVDQPAEESVEKREQEPLIAPTKNLSESKPKKSELKQSALKPEKKPVKKEERKEERKQGNNPKANRSNNRNPGGSDLKNQAFVPPSHQGAALGNRKPRYPELSLRRREEGQVTLVATVLPSGRAKSVKVHKSSGYSRLDEAALKAAREYRYQPAQKEGKAIEYDYLFTVTFKIEKR